MAHRLVPTHADGPAGLLGDEASDPLDAMTRTVGEAGAAGRLGVGANAGLGSDDGLGGATRDVNALRSAGISPRDEGELVEDALTAGTRNLDLGPASMSAPLALPLAGWYPNPTGEAGERYWDGSTWTEQARNLGDELPASSGVSIEVQPVGADLGGSGGQTFVPPQGLPEPLSPDASHPYGMSSAVASAVGSVNPAGVVRRGLPGFLVLSIIIASFPALLMFGSGALAIAAGNEISRSSSSYDDDSWYGDDGTSFGDSLSDLGNTTTGVGAVLLGIGTVALIGLVLTGQGSNTGRVLTGLWMCGLIVLMLAGISSSQASPGGLEAIMIGVPVLGVIGLFTPQANSVFRRPRPQASVVAESDGSGDGAA